VRFGILSYDYGPLKSAEVRWHLGIWWGIIRPTYRESPPRIDLAENRPWPCTASAPEGQTKHTGQKKHIYECLTYTNEITRYCCCYCFFFKMSYLLSTSKRYQIHYTAYCEPALYRLADRKYCDEVVEHTRRWYWYDTLHLFVFLLSALNIP